MARQSRSLLKNLALPVDDGAAQQQLREPIRNDATTARVDVTDAGEVSRGGDVRAFATDDVPAELPPPSGPVLTIGAGDSDSDAASPATRVPPPAMGGPQVPAHVIPDPVPASDRVPELLAATDPPHAAPPLTTLRARPTLPRRAVAAADIPAPGAAPAEHAGNATRFLQESASVGGASSSLPLRPAGAATVGGARLAGPGDPSAAADGLQFRLEQINGVGSMSPAVRLLLAGVAVVIVVALLVPLTRGKNR